MAVMIVTPAQYPLGQRMRLTTIEAVLAEVPIADQHFFAERLIEEASAAVEAYCGAMFAQQSYLEVQCGNYATSTLMLSCYPLLSVTAVLSGTTPVTDYRVESWRAGLLARRTGWYLSPWGTDEWSVEYVAGYILPEQVDPVEPFGPLLPPDIERATLETVKVWFHERMVGDRIVSRHLGEQTITYGVQARDTGIPPLARDILGPWRRVTVA